MRKRLRPMRPKPIRPTFTGVMRLRPSRLRVYSRPAVRLRRGGGPGRRGGDNEVSGSALHSERVEVFPGPRSGCRGRFGECEGDVRVAAIIPARNEAETIGPVVLAARGARSVGEVIVVDNGSTDDTGAIAAANGARVVHESMPGKGEAMRR